MAELLLSTFLGVLFDRLASRDLFSFVRQLGGAVDSELKKWDKKLKMIQAVLRDAEEKQLTDEAVKMWLDELQDLAYDVEDILDEFATQALERKLMAEDPDRPGSSSKVHNMVPAACFSCLSPITTVKFNFSMRSNIKEITSRLEELCKQRIELGLQLTPGARGTSSTAAAERRPPSSSVPTEPVVFGREEDKTKILEMVLTDTSTDHANFTVIPIVGMGGIGKTTLAREVYNDKAVEDSNKFDVKAWVCVSDDFNVLSISKALLESITRRPCRLNTLNEVQVELRVAVNRKRFLLVLDDVWNEDYSLWVDLKAPFLAAAPNSKMIITTRNSHAASIMGPIDHYNLKHLLDDDCWSIFKTHAFEGRDLNAHQISESFRKKIVGQCGGLPLAAKTLGGLLRTTGYDVWDDILDSKIWDLPRPNSILPVLRLSYHHLPSHLKSCFAYCAIFPKNYEFNEKELVFLWIAEGIIRQSSNNELLKDLGSKCFHDLVSRSIFQRTSFGSSKFVMHDLIHDLAQLVSGETIFRLEEDNSLSRRFERVRHSSYACGEFDGRNKFKTFYEIDHLRTFLPLHKTDCIITGYISSMVLYDLLPKFQKLRVLSLQGYHIGELPIPFEDLRLLRYVNLANTDIRSLPKSTCSLLNLEILILRNCTRLIKLPSKMRKLINLCHLDIKGANSLEEMPFGMKELKNLQTLSNFIVAKGEAVSGLEDLKILKFLCGELCIAGLQNVNNPQNAREAALCEKQNLKSLSLEWGNQFDNSADEVLEEQVLDMLQPHKRLKELTIKQYSGARFPLWTGDPLFSKMVVLQLENCRNCTSLPSLGLLSSLRDLTIQGMLKIKSIGCEFFGAGFSKPFQSLEILSFENLPEWEHWDIDINRTEHVEIFPRLQKLSLVECPKLSGKVPELLPSLKTLVVSKCQKLIVSLSSYPMLCRLEVDQYKELVCRIPIDSKLIKSMTISNSSLDINGCEGMLHAGRTSVSLLQTETISNALEFGKLLKPEFQILETLVVGSSRQLKSWRPYGYLRMLNKPPQELIMLACPDEVSIEESCVSLVSFPEINFFPRNLRYLIIYKSTALRSLPEEIMDNNSLLESLYIGNCDSLKFITKRKLPSSLERLQIENCKNLQHLIDGEDDASAAVSSSLRFIISYCQSLTFVARRKLPSFLKSLVIENCKNLQCLVDDEEDAPCSSFSSVTLEHLEIRDCPELTCLSSGIQLLGALEDLHICNCPKLESIPKGLHKLQSFYIKKCPSLVSLGEKGLPNTISSVSISYCEKVDALPNDMHKLKSLQHLKIKECPSILSFLEKGFPTNLKVLIIGVDVEMYKAIIQWGLHRLTSLIGLSIEECHDAESFPDKEMGMMLPPTTFLLLRRLSKLKYLSSMGFQNLTSLEYLSIEDCQNLTSFPEVGLPSSLLYLRIKDCPKLRKQCKRDKGKEWSKIAHIPCVEIDGKFIYDPEAE